MDLSNPTSDISTKELLGWLSEQLLGENQQNLDQARKQMAQWADTFAKGSGGQEKIVIMDPKEDITVAEVFSTMDRLQAERFLVELFRDIVPHMANQRKIIRDMEQGRAVGTNDQSNPMAALMSELVKHLPDGFGDLFSSIQTQAQSLTWVDDNKNTIKTNLTLGIEIGDDTSKGRGRKP